MNLKNCKLVVLLFCAQYLSLASTECQKTDISITQKLEKEGFHRDLNWLIEISALNIKFLTKSKCKLALRLKVPAEMYMDPDQIFDYNRLNLTSIYIDGKVDVEQVAHLSEPHIAYIFIDQFKEKIPLNVPVHLRYQRGQIAVKYGKAILEKLSLLGRCSEGNICSKKGQIKAPCNVTGNEMCNWKNITYQALFDDVELMVPIGDLDDYPIVSVITLLLGCAGCIYTLSVLSTAYL